MSKRIIGAALAAGFLAAAAAAQAGAPDKTTNTGCVQGEVLRYAQLSKSGALWNPNGSNLFIDVDPVVGADEVFVAQHVTLGINTNDPGYGASAALVDAPLDGSPTSQVAAYLGFATTGQGNHANLHTIRQPLTAYIRDGRKATFSVGVDGPAPVIAATVTLAGFYARDCNGI